MEVPSVVDQDLDRPGSIIAETMTLTGKWALVTGASRAAGAAIAKALASEGAANLVRPGSIDTDMFPASGPYAERSKEFMALGWYVASADIVNVVALLASARAQYINGSTFTVGGGANA
jgi:3-oxoacyl-[acyl-carrier protein] reductase